MTREKALEWFKDRKKMYCLDDKCQQAEDMAIKALEQEPCEDAISRQAAVDGINQYFHDEYYQRTSIQDCRDCLIEDVIKPLPSVNPQPKTGHWIMIDKELQRYKCSECGEVIRLYKKSEIPKLEKDETLSNYPFSHCGCRMIEPQESEE